MLLLLAGALAAASPWVGVRASVHTGFPDLYGLQVGYTGRGPLTGELGASWLGFARSASLRAGVAGRLADGPRWTVQIAPRLGYRLVHSTPPGRADLFHGVGLDVALDAARWFGDVGVTAQLQGGGTAWVARTNPAARPWLPEVRIAAGLCWRPGAP